MRRPCHDSNYINYYNNCYNYYNGNHRNPLYEDAVYCNYINGPTGLPYYSEPAMTIHRNAQAIRPYGYTTTKVPYEPLVGLGCYQEPYLDSAEVACRIRQNFY